MVLIQLLLPTSGAASADGLAPLAQTRRWLRSIHAPKPSKRLIVLAQRNAKDAATQPLATRS